jgi:acetyltransferase-like isoleucine patch superfamily enzyme
MALAREEAEHGPGSARSSRARQALLLLCTFLPSRLRLAVWRWLGMRVGPGCRVSPGSVVIADQIVLGPGAVIEPLSFVFRPAYFEMGERCRIAGFVRVLGYGRAILGPQSFVGLGSLIDCTTEVRIGDRTQIGPRSMLYSHGYSALLYKCGYSRRDGPLVIGRDCWLGMATVVYPRLEIGDRTVVSPGLVVSQSVAADKWLFPPVEPYRTGPVRIVQFGLAKGVREKELDAELLRLAGARPGSRVDRSRHDRWILELSRDERVILLRGPSSEPLAGYAQERSVVWCLECADPEPVLPTFCFAEWRVTGGWTPFAEEIAAYLCESGSAHFAFDSRQAPKPLTPAR